jgi:UDP-N-acetylmuramoyl-tripeptide--D-alanyl-D-alanine ligase
MARMMSFDLPTLLARVRDGCVWRIRDLVGDERLERVIGRTAETWRRMLTQPVYIGIVGSVGKTTTRGLLLQMLGHTRSGVGTRSNMNRPPEVARTLLRMRPGHDYCVAELSEGRPGEMEAAATLLQPDIGIVTVVGDEHVRAYGSRDALASEIRKFVASLPATGTAVLNADDDLVLAMAAHCTAEVVTYGISPTADLRAEDIVSAWPDRLRMTVVHEAERVTLRTQLCGAHWIPSVLGAIGGGLAAGFSLGECAEGIARVAPSEGRMQPVTTPDGVTFIQDDFKASVPTIDAAFAFMKAARAKRKLIVIGEIGDIGSTSRGKRYAKTAAMAQEIADLTVFVGPWAPSVLTTQRAGREHALRAFIHVRDAAAYINSVTREGDLVLLKGTLKHDHLRRVVMDRSGDIACWRDDCKRYMFCVECPDRTKPSGLPLSIENASSSSAVVDLPPTGQLRTDANEQFIVGLGNADAMWAGTPHNIGHEALDRFAASWDLAWETTPEAWIARGSSKGRRVCLIKIRTSMNRIGTGLKHLSTSMGFGPEQCILVYDDLDVPIGSVRTRLSGGAGGHRGVASVLEAFQTDAIRRVKVGVGQPGTKLNLAEYLATPLAAEGRAAADLAIATAESHIIELLTTHPIAP